jgi:hypothetical protein
VRIIGLDTECLRDRAPVVDDDDDVPPLDFFTPDDVFDVDDVDDDAPSVSLERRDDGLLPVEAATPTPDGS